MTSVFYCKGWFIRRKMVIEPWPIEKAQKAHKAGKKYTVLVGSPDRPECVLEIHRDMNFIGVTFLDELLRQTQHFSLTEYMPGRLEFNSTFKYDYGDASDEADPVTSYNFAGTPGRVGVHIGYVNFQNNVAFDGGPFDIKSHEMPWPEFGHYEELIKPDRIAWDVKPVGSIRSYTDMMNAGS